MIQNKLFELRFCETIDGFDDRVHHHVWSLPNDDDINIDFHVADFVLTPRTPVLDAIYSMVKILFKRL